MRRSPDILFAVATLCGLGLCPLGLRGVHGVITDLGGGTTITGHASDIVRRAMNPERYWGLMAAWLREFLSGALILVFFGWRACRALRRR